MPTYRGRRALVACLVLLAAGWLTAADAVAQTDPGTETTVTTAAAADPPPEYAPPRDSEPATTTTSVVAAPVETTTTTTSSASAVTPATSPATVTPGQGARVTTTTTATTIPAAGASRTAAAPATGGATTVPALADTATAGAPNPKASVSLDIPGTGGKPSQSLLIIVLITLLSVAPALLIMVTSFTRIVIVLSLTRNALGLHTIPPNQVIVGLAMFLSFFVMSPTFGDINRDAIQPLLKGEKTQSQAYDSAVTPLRTFMLKQTRKGELAMFSSAANGGKRPEKPEDVGLAALIPAFILSELKTAFIIGFVIFIPFLVIDIVVSSSLMSMGMMMLPPVFVSLPFKLLLFVMVDGWGLVVRSLLKSFA